MSVRALPVALLMCLAFAAEAREVRMAGAGGDGGGCSADYPSGATAEADPARPARRPDSDKAPMSRGSDPDAARPPRWHSFLPGMFR